MVMVGGVTAANFPHVVRNSRRSSSSEGIHQLNRFKCNRIQSQDISGSHLSSGASDSAVSVVPHRGKLNRRVVVE